MVVLLWCINKEPSSRYLWYEYIGVRAGGARGAAAPPQILGNSDFFGQQEKIWAKPGFKDVSLFFYCYFKEINILYFILTKILTSVGVIIKLHSLET